MTFVRWLVDFTKKVRILKAEGSRHVVLMVAAEEAWLQQVDISPQAVGEYDSFYEHKTLDRLAPETYPIAE